MHRRAIGHNKKNLKRSKIVSPEDRPSIDLIHKKCMQHGGWVFQKYDWSDTTRSLQEKKMKKIIDNGVQISIKKRGREE